MIAEALAATQSAVSITDEQVITALCSIIAACAVLITGICGWVWISTIGWIKRVAEKMDQHILDDTEFQKEVTATININHIEIIKLLPKREDDIR